MDLSCSASNSVLSSFTFVSALLLALERRGFLVAPSVA